MALCSGLNREGMPVDQKFIEARNSSVLHTMYIDIHYCSMSQSQTTGMEECSTGDSSQINFQPLCPSSCPYSLARVFFASLCEKGEKWPASVDRGLSIASQDTCHVHGAPCLNLPTSPYPTLSDNAEPTFKVDCTN